jgi:tight adherence protein B
VLPDKDSMSRRLSIYEAGAAGAEGDDGASAVTNMPLFQRAVAITGDVAEKRGLLEKIEVDLERASLPVRAAEAVVFVAVLAVFVGLVTYILTGSFLLGGVALVVAAVVPKAVVSFKVRRRQKAFVQQLPDMLALLAGTLKAGYSITQGFEAVSKEIEEPMGRELRRVVTEHRLGRSLEDALDATGERMDSDDFAWTVMAIKSGRSAETSPSC